MGQQVVINSGASPDIAPVGAAKWNSDTTELYQGADVAGLTPATQVNAADLVDVLQSQGSVTFTASVGGASSGTLTSASLSNGSYVFLFNDGETQVVAVSGTACTWPFALNAGTITTASVYLRKQSTVQGTGGVYPVTTAQQLNFANPSPNGNPTVQTLDGGLQTYTNGYASLPWQSAVTFPLLVTGVPIGIPPSGTIGNNGALTLGTALDTTYASIYFYFPSGAIASGSQPGLYFVQMSSTTVGIIYQNQYRRGQPPVPSSPTAFTTTGPGAYTQTGQVIYLHTCPVPGNTIGLNGELEVNVVGTNNSSGNNKNYYLTYGGQNLCSVLQNTTTTNFSYCHRMINRGVTNAQIILNSNTGEPGTATGNVYNTVDTTEGQTLWVSGYLSTNTDWLIIQSFSAQMKPSGFLDYPPAIVLSKSGANVVPNGAAALGYTSNLFYLQPKVSDIDFTGVGTTLSLFPGLYYNPQPNWSNSTGSNPPYATMVTVGNRQVLCLSQKGDGVTPGLATQNQNSQAGALPYLTASTGFYMEWETWLSNEDPDHWPALWSIPQEHRTTGDCLQYPEFDVDELASNVAGPGGYNANRWMDTTIINWQGSSFTASMTAGTTNATMTVTGSVSGYPLYVGQAITGTSVPSYTTITAFNTGTGGAGTYTVSTNANVSSTTMRGGFHPTDYQNSFAVATLGAAIDRTRAHVVGMSYDPVGEVCQFWLDGAKCPFSVSTAPFNSSFATYHFYMIMGPQQRGGQVPYNMYISYLSAWT